MGYFLKTCWLWIAAGELNNDHLPESLKCPYYAFSKITFHAVCHVAVCEHKLSAKL